MGRGRSGFTISEETIPHRADRDGRVGQTITVKCGETTAPIPASEFFEHDAFNIVGDARLAQASHDAGDLRSGRTPIYRVRAQRVELDEDFEQLVVELSIARLDRMLAGAPA